MAKRFTDTDKWKDEWFLELEPTMKMLWIYILDTCDHAGIWRANFKLASYCIGTILDKQSASKALESRIKIVDEDKWHVPKFIAYQYKGKLNPDNKAHLGVINSLTLHGLDSSPFLAPFKPLPSQDTLDQRGLGIGIGTGVGIGLDLVSSSESFDPRKFLDAKKILPQVESEENLKTEKFTPDHFVDLWNETFGPRLCYTQSLGSGKHRDNFLKSLEFLPTEKHWRDLFELCLKSPKCMGQNDIGWTVTPTWIVDFDNALKVLNGDFDDAKHVKNLFASMQSGEVSA